MTAPIVLSTGAVVVRVPDLSSIPAEKKERILNWCAALESGEYCQGVGNLYFHNTTLKVMQYCCLGVGADVAVKEGLGEWVLAPDSAIRESIEKDQYYGHAAPGVDLETGEITREESESFFTKPLKDFYGVTGSGAIDIGLLISLPGFVGEQTLPVIVGRASLQTLNDYYKATFKDVALILRSAVEGGFGSRENPVYPQEYLGKPFDPTQVPLTY